MKPLLSVLMSIYNETESQIRESVESILEQSFRDFEFIIVCDNPDYLKAVEIIDSYHDSRIIYEQNEKNIGLALSMNKAASLATTDIFVRMDADDIAEKDRLAKLVDCFNGKHIDFAFSRYCYIDEESKLINNNDNLEYFEQSGLSNIIALSPSIIHHPTVIFTREIFEKVGGYRDFPCSQDADLWLRMQEAGCRFFMLPDKLLRYRLSSNSVSSKKWFQQQLTIHYIMQLSYERLTKGKDSYSKENYNRYLHNKGVNDETKAKALLKSEKILSKALHERRNGHVVKSITLRIYVFLTSKTLRDYYICVMKKKRIMKHIM